MSSAPNETNETGPPSILLRLFGALAGGVSGGIGSAVFCFLAAIIGGAGGGSLIIVLVAGAVSGAVFGFACPRVLFDSILIAFLPGAE